MLKLKSLCCIILVTILVVTNYTINAINTDLDDKFYDNFLSSTILKVNNHRALHNCVETKLDQDNENVKVFKKNDEIYVPIYFLASCFKDIVDKNDEKSVIFEHDNKCIIISSENKVIVNNELMSFNAPIEMSDGIIFVPINEFNKKVYNRELFVKNDIIIIGEKNPAWKNKVDNKLITNINDRFTDMDNQLFLIAKDGKVGYIDINGKVIIQPKYAYARVFKEGVAIVKGFDNKEYFFIDKKGNKTTKNGFNRLIKMSCGLSIATYYDSKKDTYKNGLVDRNGNCKIITNNLSGDFSEGLTICRPDDDKTGWGYMDRKGKVVIGFKYEYATEFIDGRAIVVVDDKYGYINKKGEYIIKPQYYFYNGFSFGYFSDGIAVVNFGDSDKVKLGYIDKSGEKVTNEYYDDGYAISFGRARVGRITDGNIKYGFIDRKGKEVIPLKFDYAESFIDGMALVKVNSKYNFIDPEGNIISENWFNYAISFSEGLACVWVKEKGIGFIDKRGKFVIEPKFSSLGSFINGLAYTNDGTIEGYINKQGKYVWSKKYIH